ncbi:hypothetical protein CHUAL_012698 [Chamberlinius hualienensis]
MVSFFIKTECLIVILGILSWQSLSQSVNYSVPLVINTWLFSNANEKAWQVLVDEGKSGMDALIAGCRVCEDRLCEDSIGWGGHPDEKEETTLDAMVMDGTTHAAGAVASLRRVKYAISVARAVMQYTKHTLLVGDQATDFAVEMGFANESLYSNESIQTWLNWKNSSCQPNYRTNVVPDPTKSCGPYSPVNVSKFDADRQSLSINEKNHDTIGMVIIDSNSNIVCGTTTNGAQFRVPGRVGDSPIVGSGAYCDKDVGGAAGTGDGDIMMRFLPAYQAVESMRHGISPKIAAEDAVARILVYYPTVSAAVVAASITGEYGAGCVGMSSFTYSVRNPSLNTSTVLTTPCLSGPQVVTDQ